MTVDYDYLTKIAVEVSNSRHGDFLKTLALAWQLADSENRDILFQAWTEVIAKYHLEKLLK